MKGKRVVNNNNHLYNNNNNIIQILNYGGSKIFRGVLSNAAK